LSVTESRDGLDRDRHLGAAAGEKRVEGAEVTGDGNWGLELPAPSVPNSCAEAPKQVELRSITESTACWIEASAKAETHGGPVPRELNDSDVVKEAEFNATDMRDGCGDRPRNVCLLQATG
jgi:hypothetical protein